MPDDLIFGVNLGSGATDAAAGNHTHSGAYAPYTDPLKPAAFLAETMSRVFKPEGTGTFPLASGRLTLQAIALPPGLLVSSITFVSGSTGLGTPTNQWAALFDNTRTKLAISADGTTAAWSAWSAKTYTMTTPYLTTYGGLHYLGLCIVGATMPSIVGIATNGETGAMLPWLNGDGNSGLTNPASCPTTPTLAQQNLFLYAGVA